MNMERTNSGLEIVKKGTNSLGVEVSLTRKTTKGGNIRHGVVLTNHYGMHTRLKSFLGIAPAFALYKQMVNL